MRVRAQVARPAQHLRRPAGFAGAGAEGGADVEPLRGTGHCAFTWSNQRTRWAMPGPASKHGAARARRNSYLSSAPCGPACRARRCAAGCRGTPRSPCDTARTPKGIASVWAGGGWVGGAGRGGLDRPPDRRAHVAPRAPELPLDELFVVIGEERGVVAEEHKGGRLDARLLGVVVDRRVGGEAPRHQGTAAAAPRRPVVPCLATAAQRASPHLGAVVDAAAATVAGGGSHAPALRGRGAGRGVSPHAAATLPQRCAPLPAAAIPLPPRSPAPRVAPGSVCWW